MIERLGEEDVADYRALMKVFEEAFDDPDSYGSLPPDDAYVQRLLGKDEMIFLVVKRDTTVVAGLVAYVLEKFEQPRSEIYIYDLAVAEAHRRQGFATSLIEKLRSLARSFGAYVIFVQADYVDPPAIALYESLGNREEVLHFDIDVET